MSDEPPRAGGSWPRTAKTKGAWVGRHLAWQRRAASATLIPLGQARLRHPKFKLGSGREGDRRCGPDCRGGPVPTADRNGDEARRAKHGIAVSGGRPRPGTAEGRRPASGPSAWPLVSPDRRALNPRIQLTLRRIADTTRGGDDPDPGRRKGLPDTSTRISSARQRSESGAVIRVPPPAGKEEPGARARFTYNDEGPENRLPDGGEGAAPAQCRLAWRESGRRAPCRDAQISERS